MSRYEEISREIQETRFVSQIPELERKCLIALHRHEVSQEQYNKLRLDCMDRLCIVCPR